MPNAKNVGTNFKQFEAHNESHILALEIPIEGRARSIKRESIWMVDYEKGEGL